MRCGHCVCGGSALDVGKVIRLCLKRPDKPLIPFEFEADWSGLAPCVAIPTTAGTGSEVGRSSVIIKDGRKQVVFHPSLLASLVISILNSPAACAQADRRDGRGRVDSLPRIVHLAGVHPLCDGIALEGIHLIGEALPVRSERQRSRRARPDAGGCGNGRGGFSKRPRRDSFARPSAFDFLRVHHGTANALCAPFVMEFNAARKPGTTGGWASHSG